MTVITPRYLPRLSALLVVCVGALVLTVTGCKDGPFSTQHLPALEDDAELPSFDSLGVNDPDFLAGRQWYLDIINAQQAWQVMRALEDLGPLGTTVVAVIDTTVDLNHEDMAGVFTSDGYDFIRNSGVLLAPADNNNDSHSTHVSGLVATRGGNARGIVGIGYNLSTRQTARVMPLVMLDSNGGGTPDGLRESILYAVDEHGSSEITPEQRARVVNMSLGGGSSGVSSARELSNYLRAAAAAAVARNSILVAASGNWICSATTGECQPARTFLDAPAYLAEVIAVGSVDAVGSRVAGEGTIQRSLFSSYSVLEGGPLNEDGSLKDGALELMAPGGQFIAEDGIPGILSTIPRNRYGYQQGTSMAAPLVAGVAAMVRSANPALSAGQVRQILRDTAQKVWWDPDDETTHTDWHEEFGFGVVDAAAAVRAARSASPSFAPSVVLPARQPVEPVHATWDAAGIPRVLVSVDPDVMARQGVALEDIAAYLQDITGVAFHEVVTGVYFRGEVPEGHAAQEVLNRLNTTRGVRQALQDRVITFR